MAKKLFILFLIFICLGFSGCGSSEKESGDDQLPAVEDETLVVINDIDFHLNRETSFQDIGYTAVEEFREIEHDEFTPYIQYDYQQEDGSNLLFFRIFYYQDKDFDAAVRDLGIEGDIALTDGKTENIEYQLYAQPRDDGGTIHFYFISRDGDTYVLHFVSRYDIAVFEEKVLYSIHF